jgi:hypothetical protein
MVLWLPATPGRDLLPGVVVAPGLAPLPAGVEGDRVGREDGPDERSRPNNRGEVAKVRARDITSSDVFGQAGGVAVRPARVAR